MRAWTLLAATLLVACAKKEETTSPSPVASEAPPAASAEPAPEGKLIYVTKSAAVASSSAPIAKHPPRMGIIDTRPAMGAANVKDADSVIARNRWRFKACYDKAEDPQAQGAVNVAFELGEGGEVVKSSAKAANAALSDVATCIADHGTKMKFAPPDGGQAKLTFTATFKRRD
jgi:hypothetical protein